MGSPQEELVVHLLRIEAARTAVPPEHASRLDALRSQVEQALCDAYKTRIAARQTPANAVTCITYPEVLPVVEAYFERYGVDDPAVRKLVTDFALEIAAQKLYLEGTNATDHTDPFEDPIVHAIPPDELTSITTDADFGAFRIRLGTAFDLPEGEAREREIGFLRGLFDDYKRRLDEGEPGLVDIEYNRYRSALERASLPPGRRPRRRENS